MQRGLARAGRRMKPKKAERKGKEITGREGMGREDHQLWCHRKLVILANVSHSLVAGGGPAASAAGERGATKGTCDFRARLPAHNQTSSVFFSHSPSS